MALALDLAQALALEVGVAAEVQELGASNNPCDGGIQVGERTRFGVSALSDEVCAKMVLVLVLVMVLVLVSVSVLVLESE